MRKLSASVVVLFAVATGQAFAASPISAMEASALAERVGRPQLQQLLKDKGNTDPSDSYEQKRVETDDQVHVHVRQTRGGVPVWGGEAILHLDRDGQVTGVTDDFVAKVAVQNVGLRTVTAQQAINTAMKMTGISQKMLSVPASADQWIFRQGKQDHLAWRVTLVRTDGSLDTAIPVLFIDARSGEVLWQYNNLQTGTGNSMYAGTVTLTTTLSGSTYQLKDGSRGNQQTNDLNHGTSGAGAVFTDADDVWGNGLPSNAQTAGVDAQFGTQVTWDYYLNVHGRNGIANNGVGAYNRVHYSNAYVNAFWDDSCFCMTYGDGSGNNKPLTSIDVAGHEMSHGVTSRTANLTYSGESGGLNEATSDIFGTSVEFYAANAQDVGDYLIGEKININGNGTPLRYMDKPSSDGSSADCWYSGIGSLDVHYSSGVANHFFYLLSEGSGAKTINGVSYNSPTCNSSTVTGIGRAKAEKIWYRALTVYMTASTNYAGARTATLNAAADLYGAGSADQTAVDAAWAAVSVGPPAPPPPPTVLTNGVPVTGIGGSTGTNKYYTLVVPAGQSSLTFQISGGSGDADMFVKFGAAPDSATYDCRPYLSGNAETCTFSNPAAGTWWVMLNAYSTYSGVTLVGTYTGGGGGGGSFANGGFETGTTPWVFAGYGSRVTTGLMHGGVAASKLGGTNNGSGTISQDFQVPASGNSLTFWLQVTTAETTTVTQYDKLFVEVRNTSGTLLTTLATYSNLNKSAAYVQKGGFSLAAYAGQTIRLQFRSTSDISLTTDFRIDDVAVQ
ncbi:MAG TPA: M4 family metallopeptidase [Myxococcaceae bacterium]